MNSFAYDLSNSSSLKCFTFYNENEDITPKDLNKVVEDPESQTSMIEDTILINLGPLEEHRELKIEISLTAEDQENITLLLWKFIDVIARP